MVIEYTDDDIVRLNVYGLSGYVAGSFFNIDCSDTCTSGGRNIIAVASITNELLGKGFRHYSFSAHMKIIDKVIESDCDDICSRYTLPLVDDEEILKTMLLYHYDGYYRLTALRRLVSHLTDNQKRVLYLKNNFEEFCKVPEVEALFRDIIISIKDTNMIEVDPKSGAKMMSPYGNPLVKDKIKKLGEMICELSFGFFFYEGDWVDGVYYPTLEDIVTNMHRNKIAGMDTDSNITTLYSDKNYILELYKDVIGDKVNDKTFTDSTLIMIIQALYVTCIQKGLKDYARSIGIDEDNLHHIDLECELVIAQDHLTISKKNYVFRRNVKDFQYKPGAIDIRGLKMKKSDSNAAIADKVNQDIDNFILRDLDKLDYKFMVNSIHNETQNTVNMIKSERYITDDKSVFKIQEPDDISWGDTRMKAIRLWNRLVPDLPVEIPGSFGVIKVKITPEVLEFIQHNYPEVFKSIMLHAEELNDFSRINKVIKKVELIMFDEDSQDDEEEIEDEIEDDDELEDDNSEDEAEEDAENFRTKAKVPIYIARGKLLDKIRSSSQDVKEVMKKICRALYNRYDTTKYNQTAIDDFKQIMKDLPEETSKAVNKILTLSNKTNMIKFVESKINRIAVPIDINTVPEFLKFNDFQILDIGAANEYEQLISPLLFGMSIQVPKNKKKNAVLTNILQTF